MTAATSAKKPNYFGKRFAYGIQSNRKLIAVNFILSILGTPMALLLTGLFCLMAQNMDVIEANRILIRFYPIVYVSYGMAIAAGLIGVVIALFNFSYLYRKTEVDMNYSLPLKNSQRFFADYFSGLVSYVVPNAVSLAIAVVIGVIFGPYMHFDVEVNMLAEGVKLTAMLIMAGLLFYSVCVFAITMCGSLFEAIFSVVSYIACVPIVIFSTSFATFFFFNFGITYGECEDTLLYMASGPVGAVKFIYDHILYYSGDISMKYPANQVAMWMVLAGLMFVLHTLLACFLYSRRKAEDVSKPYVYKGFFYAIMTSILFTLATLSRELILTMFPGVIIGAVLWFIMEIITRRGFKKIWMGAISFAAALCVVIFITSVALRPAANYIGKRIPNADNVTMVGIGGMDFVSKTNIYTGDRDVIEAVTELHKNIIDLKNDPENGFEYVNCEGDRYIDGKTVSIEYFLKSGEIIKRSYEIPSGMAGELIEKIMLTDEYANSRSNSLTLSTEYSFSDAYTVSVSDKFCYSSANMKLSIEEFKELKDALKADMMALTHEDMAHLSEVKYCLSNDIYVYDFYENTIDFIEKHCPAVPALTVDNLESGKMRVSVEPMIVFNNIEYHYDNYIYSKNMSYFASSTDDLNVKDHYTLWDKMSATSKSLSYLRSCYYIDTEAEGIMELIGQFTPVIYDSKPLAIFQFDGTFFLPDTEENRALLKKYAIYDPDGEKEPIFVD